MAKFVQSLAVLVLLLVAFCAMCVQGALVASSDAVPKKKWAFSRYTPTQKVDGLEQPPVKSSVRAGDFNFLILALQKCESSSPWTIHGLWPSYTDSTGPSFCSNVAFQQSAIQDLWAQILQVWPSCSWSGSSETDFLSHEWTKHGTCAGVAEHDYFSDVLSIYQADGWQSYCANESSNECKVQVNSL
jgi:hypothetical protein